MVDAVRSRPNHYELLGITQAASGNEIAQAFAKELGLLPLRPFGSLAQVSIAYETLRDPIKRIAYDASLRPKSEPGQSLIKRLESAPFIGRTAVEAAKAPAHPEPSLSLIPLPRSAPSASELLRQPSESVRREPQPIPAQRPKTVSEPAVAEKPKAEPKKGIDPSLFNAMERIDHNESASIDSKLPAFAAGAVMLAVVLGAWTGWEAGNDNEAPPPDRIATHKAPAAAVPSVENTRPVASASDRPKERAEQRTSQAIAKPRPARIRPPLSIELPEKEPVELAHVDQGHPDQSAAEQAVTEASPIVATAAKIPLPNAVIARTIGRIGYACGQVVSATPIEGGAPGVFKVTCTSGHSYRAAPVRGRYHFRRMGSR